VTPASRLGHDPDCWLRYGGGMRKPPGKAAPRYDGLLAWDNGVVPRRPKGDGPRQPGFELLFTSAVVAAFARQQPGLSLQFGRWGYAVWVPCRIA
jgi:hypothetical protein